MLNADISPGILSVNAELNAGIDAIADARFGQAHAILLALFLAPEIPLWFRKMFCAEPLRQLARAYLPTRAALRRMRDHAADRLINGEHGAVLLGRTLLLDEALDDRDARLALLRRLDVFAGDLLVRCRDTVILAFAEHGDIPRARKYLGDYRATGASLAKLQGLAHATGCDWAQTGMLAHAGLYVHSMTVAREILRASGEPDAAGTLQASALLPLTDPGFRACVERELCEPGVCLEELRSWFSQSATPVDRQRRFEEAQQYPAPPRQANIAADRTR